jgi:general secretion pathway protein I
MSAQCRSPRWVALLCPPKPRAKAGSPTRPNRKYAGRASWGQAAPPQGRMPRAFTLIEVLLSVALFAIAVVVLAGAYVNVIEGVESVRSDRAFEQELRWIREKVLLEPDLDKVEDGDDAPTPDFGTARWDVTVEPTGVADLFLISLHVEMEGKDDEPLREANEQFMVLRPAWSEPIDRDKLRNEARARIEEARRFHGVLSEEKP